MDEPNIPQWVTDRLSHVLPTLSEYFPSDSLVMGGGTVLQARWNHRISTDIDLFADSHTFQRVISTSASNLEQGLYRIVRLDSKRSWVEANTIYCEIEGTELTVMPTDVLTFGDSGYVVPNTTVKTEISAAILHKKIRGRMIGGGEYEIRDLYDLYMAIERDPESLQQAIQAIPRRSLLHITAMLQSLPVHWFDETTTPLIGVEDPPSPRTLIQKLIQCFEEM